MAHVIPEGFKSLVDASEAPVNTFTNVIGIVVDFMTAAPSRRGEIMLSFKLMDLKLADSRDGQEGFQFRYFNRDEDQLPKIRNIGDAMHIRNIKIMLVSGQRLGLSNFSTRTVVVPSAKIPTPAFSIGYHDKNRMEGLGTPLALQDFGLREQAYVIALRHSAGMTSILADRLARMSMPESTNATANALSYAGPYAPSKAPTNAPTNAPPKAPANDAPSKAPPNAPTGPASMRPRPPVQQQKQKFVETDVTVQPLAKKPKQYGTFGRKFKLIEELEPKMYADICGIVVKIFPAEWGCDLYITDYTANEQMRYYPKPEEETSQERDGDTFGYSGPPKKEWPGPYEWLVLKVNLKRPHANYAQRYISEGDCVLLSNVIGKYSREGVARLEADLWPEFDQPERIKIKKMTIDHVPEIQALMQRKAKYWEMRQAAQRPIAEEAESNRAARKAAKKRKKKEEKEAAKLAQEAQEKAELARKDINPNVRCNHGEIPVTKVVDILDPENKNHINAAPDGREYLLPFVNVKYRAKVRVVDFEPRDLKDFAVPPEPAYDSDDDADPMDWIDNSPSHEWYFQLLLEDASLHKSETNRHRVWVNVHHESAQFLLGKLPDPENLQHNRELLGQLREKLFLLWGNLEENGGENLSNLPFECVIMEYGIPLEDDDPVQDATLQGWRRMYAMEGASIL